MPGTIRVGIGGWTFKPWRGTFYPDGLTQKRELEYASRALTSIEINGTYYSTFKPDSWRKWREETPEDFVFAVKASRFCTNRRVLTDAAESIERFLGQGMSELGDKLGPINWQLAHTKKFDAEDIAGFLALLPEEVDGVPLRHALEVRHPSFETDEFYDLARDHNAAIVCAAGGKYSEIDQPTADFSYARFMSTSADQEIGVSGAELGKIAKRTKGWADRGDVFGYFISGEKVKNPAAAQALIKKVG
ncbi:MAG: DUF72 domain-containing protein [Maricaulaceae bacterium]|jgi:uncharacterized protein YecE (DUF72 family)